MRVGGGLGWMVGRWGLRGGEFEGGGAENLGRGEARLAGVAGEGDLEEDLEGEELGFGEGFGVFEDGGRG